MLRWDMGWLDIITQGEGGIWGSLDTSTQGKGGTGGLVGYFIERNVKVRRRERGDVWTFYFT